MDIQKLTQETKLKIENLKSQRDNLKKEIPPVFLFKVFGFLTIFLMWVFYMLIYNEFNLFDNTKSASGVSIRTAAALGSAIGTFRSFRKLMLRIPVVSKYYSMKKILKKIKELEIEIDKLNIKKWRDKRNKTLQK